MKKEINKLEKKIDLIFQRYDNTQSELKKSIGLSPAMFKLAYELVERYHREVKEIIKEFKDNVSS